MQRDCCRKSRKTFRSKCVLRIGGACPHNTVGETVLLTLPAAFSTSKAQSAFVQSKTKQPAVGFVRNDVGDYDFDPAQ